jgi:hypothetical protein
MNEHVRKNGFGEKEFRQLPAVFSREFFEEDTSIAVRKSAEYMASEYTSHELISKGAEVTVFLEGLYPDLNAKESEMISSRIGHTLVAAHDLLRQQEDLPPLRLTERYGVIFAFSSALICLDNK